MENFKFFFKGKKVLITGHTGFKGSWLYLVLERFGAEILGYSIGYNTGLSPLTKEFDNESSIQGDINDYLILERNIMNFEPEIIFHLAAQPLVLKSFEDPIGTYKTNLIGSLNLLNVIKDTPSVKSVVIITSDKVYKNNSNINYFSEDDELGGGDPYSASKAALEIALASWINSFVKHEGNFRYGISSVRSGNVIGGWDWGENRLVPDYFRSWNSDKSILIRNPGSIRPWQHVLDVINGYLFIAMKIYQNPTLYSSSYNLGPNYSDITVLELLDKFNKKNNQEVQVVQSIDISGRESKVLMLNSEKLHSIGWRPKLDIDQAIKLTIDCYKSNSIQVAHEQIKDYFDEK